MTSGSDLWKLAAALLRNEISDGVWHSTFAAIGAVDQNDNKLLLSVPNAIVREKLDSRYRPLVEDAVAEAHGSSLQVEFEIPVPTLFDDAEGSPLIDPMDLSDADLHKLNSRLSDVDTNEITSHAPFPSTARKDSEGTSVWSSESTLQNEQQAVGLPRRYSFDGFVIGPSNRFAHAAALSVAERPGGSYNPLFIYGDAGLGKTHLLQAIEHYVNDVYPQMKVRYVSTETFLNEFVDSIKTSQGADFKRRYRHIDVLLVDDIQFIAGKDGLQEEFFHTFNELYSAGKQIVLSSDRPPDAIPTLEDRLRSRFMMGLLTDIQPPDIETRMAILGKKADRDGYFLPNEVSEFIATNITTNIRELEGALNRVTAFANLNQVPMTEAVAERTLRDFIADRQPRPITVSMILTATAEHFNFSIEDLTGKSRRRPLVIARQIAMYVSRELTDLSFPMIAREFGGRDHTTVMHACDKIAALMKERSQIYDQVTALDKTVREQANAA